MQAPATTQRTKLSVEIQEATGAGERLSSRFPFVRPGEEAEQEVRRYHPERTAVVAVDVGKDVNHLYIRTSAYQEIVPPIKLQTLATGYEHVVGLVDELLRSGAPSSKSATWPPSTLPLAMRPIAAPCATTPARPGPPSMSPTRPTAPDHWSAFAMMATQQPYSADLLRHL